MTVISTYLVTGGAGFIGSHFVKYINSSDNTVVVIDNLQLGHSSAVISGVDLFDCDLMDTIKLNDVFSRYKFDAVFHFAGLSSVAASMVNPLRYCRENLCMALNLAESAVLSGCFRLVVSSTAALFTPPPDGGTISDEAVPDPQNAYGESKLLIERSLAWAEQAHGLKFAALRYFNAAGCDPEGDLGEDHDPETHLIPIAIDAALGRRPPLSIYGTDYPTRDGTAIRDYVHVNDIAAAHLAVLAPLERGSCHYNIGTGCGSTVREVVEAVERVSGLKVPTVDAERRKGDAVVLIAESSRFSADTGWAPRWKKLDDLVSTAWAWRRDRPYGYGRSGSTGS